MVIGHLPLFIYNLIVTTMKGEGERNLNLASSYKEKYTMQLNFKTFDIS